MNSVVIETCSDVQQFYFMGHDNLAHTLILWRNSNHFPRNLCVFVWTRFRRERMHLAKFQDKMLCLVRSPLWLTGGIKVSRAETTQIRFIWRWYVCAEFFSPLPKSWFNGEPLFSTFFATREFIIIQLSDAILVFLFTFNESVWDRTNVDTFLPIMVYNEKSLRISCQTIPNLGVSLRFETN